MTRVPEVLTMTRITYEAETADMATVRFLCRTRVNGKLIGSTTVATLEWQRKFIEPNFVLLLGVLFGGGSYELSM